MATDMDIEMDIDVGLMDEDLDIEVVPEVDTQVGISEFFLLLRSLPYTLERCQWLSS